MAQQGVNAPGQLESRDEHYNQYLFGIMNGRNWQLVIASSWLFHLPDSANTHYQYKLGDF